MRILISVGSDTEVNRNYAKPFAALGVEAVLSWDVATDDLSCDGVVFSGGYDLEPCRYGQHNIAAGQLNAERDRRELALFSGFLSQNKPIFGICRGHQLINVALGGTLLQNIPNAEQFHRTVPGTPPKSHAVLAKPGSILAELYGTDPFTVNSYHHQAIARLGDGLAVTAISAVDGIIEAVEHTERPIFSVQWHPERSFDDRRNPGTVDMKPLFERYLSLF